MKSINTSYEHEDITVLLEAFEDLKQDREWGELIDVEVSSTGGNHDVVDVMTESVKLITETEPLIEELYPNCTRVTVPPYDGAKACSIASQLNEQFRGH